MFDAKKFCDDYNIKTKSSGKHARQGWIQIRCPLCTGNPGWHGGFNITKEYYNCWRCGWHWIPKIISVLTKNPIHIARRITSKYISGSSDLEYKERKYVKEVLLPSGTEKVKSKHLEYLLSRGFNRNTVRLWNLMGTGVYGDYKFRIIIPIYLDNQLISYTSRDITNKSKLKYKDCENINEVYHHKYSLYGVDKVKGDTCIIVEGPADVWKLGEGAAATFGIDFTKKQIDMISQRFKNVFIYYDPEIKAQDKAYELAQELGKYSSIKSVEIIDIDHCDPGDLSPDEVNQIRKELF